MTCVLHRYPDMSAATHKSLEFPPDLLYSICAQLFAFALPPDQPSLDPLLILRHDTLPTGDPSSYPPNYCPEPLIRRTLANLCLVNHSWYTAAKPWLWNK
jgi:hypothetical protein